MMNLRRKRDFVHEINPDEIFLDSSNLPHLDEAQFEGRVERPVSRAALFGVGAVFALGACIFVGQAFALQVIRGETYAELSRNNRLERTVIFASRGIIYDRAGVALAWNEAPPHTLRAEGATSQTVSTTSATSTDAVDSRDIASYPLRRYTDLAGFSHLLGYVRYPRRDNQGLWWREEYAGVSGAEFVFDALLSGVNGSQLVEEDARGEVRREHIVDPPRPGGDVHLTIDADVQNKLATILSDHAERNGFQGGAGAIMDVKTGELLALTSFPEYDNAGFAAGDGRVVNAANSDKATPILHRAIAGLYAPGSIVKPMFAAAALAEDVVDPEYEILSTGELVVPNPYDPSKPSRFRDWKAHGFVDMRRALAVSSDQYFYVIGGGFGGVRGLGIERIDAYARAFGFGSPTGVSLRGEEAGVIPTPAWKEEVFGEDDPWRLGDTYITAIGQFGFQITPLQAAVFASALANDGAIMVPRVTAGEATSRAVPIAHEDLQVVREGMRAAVSSDAADRTARALDMPGMHIAGKTGTAELGERNQFMHSWVIGFWPYENPRFAFAVVLEKAPAGTLAGAAPAMRPFFEWLADNKPEYVAVAEPESLSQAMH